ncbi:MAG: glycosyltransferase [Bacteroidetes bacterium]|nr:glycosyltransferase [Bacteroidota bacterium]
MKYSVVIIAFNESKRIEKLLSSIQGADEILVVDSNSSDRTSEIAKSFGARVIQHDFEGFGQQKQFGVDEAKNEWILSLDADEVPDPALWKFLEDQNEEDIPFMAWYLKRYLVFMGRAFRFGKESKDFQLRFFHRKHAQWTTPAVHEKVETKARTGVLPGKVAHYSFDSIDNYLGKFNRYTSLAAEDLVNRGKNRLPLINFFLIPINFLKFYLLQLNFMNGYAGLCWSVFSSIYPYVKYSKAYDIRRRQ